MFSNTHHKHMLESPQKLTITPLPSFCDSLVQNAAPTQPCVPRLTGSAIQTSRRAAMTFPMITAPRPSPHCWGQTKETLRCSKDHSWPSPRRQRTYFRFFFFFKERFILAIFLLRWCHRCRCPSAIVQLVRFFSHRTNKATQLFASQEELNVLPLKSLFIFFI